MKYGLIQRIILIRDNLNVLKIFFSVEVNIVILKDVPNNVVVDEIPTKVIKILSNCEE